MKTQLQKTLIKQVGTLHINLTFFSFLNALHLLFDTIVVIGAELQMAAETEPKQEAETMVSNMFLTSLFLSASFL